MLVKKQKKITCRKKNELKKAEKRKNTKIKKDKKEINEIALKVFLKI